ncbi:MAG: hypothetical protein ACN23H_02730 [Candidatus Phytoplasma vitis]
MERINLSRKTKKYFQNIINFLEGEFKIKKQIYPPLEKISNLLL